MSHAYWRKCDFQVHTPRDPGWAGARPIGIGDQIAGRPATIDDVKAARLAWANSFVDACISRDLEAVALTDHHEMIMFPYVEQAVTARRLLNPSFDLWVFPGMELTTRGGCQCLIIFDADLDESWRQQVQGKLGIVYSSLNENAAQGPAVVQLAYNYADLGSQLDALGDGIKGRYIVLPNVSQGGGHTVMKNGHYAEFKRMPYVGGYLDSGQTIDTLTSNKSKLSGKNADWGTRDIYPLPTSDSRSHDFSKLGTNDTWIKLAAPTAEAIRQAFLGYQSRIAINRPSVASLRVVSVELFGSTIIADGTLTFSPELNSFIGGRGSGKSSYLEYIAFGLGRSCFDMAKPDYSGTDRLASLVKDTIVDSGGTIKLSINQDNATFFITRSIGNGYQPKVIYPNSSEQLLSTKELRSLFPAVLYSQGELSEIGKQAGRRAQLSELLQFVNPEFKREDDRLIANINSAKLAVRGVVQELSQSWSKQAELHKLQSAKGLLEQRIAALQKSLPALSEAEQAVVRKHEEMVAFEGQRLQASKQIEVVMLGLTELWRQAAKPAELDSALPESANLQALYQQFNVAFKDGVAALGKMLGKIRDEFMSASDLYAQQLAVSRSDQNAVMAKLVEHTAVTKQIALLQDEMQNIVSQIGDLLIGAALPEERFKQFNDRIDALKSSVRTRAVRTAAWATEIEALSSGRIRAELHDNGELTELRDAVDAISAKTGSQEATRQRLVNDRLAEISPWELLDEIRTDCLLALGWKQLGAAFGEKPSCKALGAVIGGGDKTHASCMELMDIAKVEAIATAVPRPDITLWYCDGDRRITFEKASEGQRAAALLFMLLQQPGGPLIVDQPEGDLDNRVISDLTGKLHDAKQNRQIFFASHNANIVVNGSSELVAHLEMHDDGKRGVERVGAIDNVEICKTITATMEGGEKAFRDRHSKYGY